MTDQSARKVLCVTLVYEYEVDPEHYPNGNDPYAMALLDIEQDPAVILSAEWKIERAVLR